MVFDETCEGAVVFEVEGVSYRIEPISEVSGELFLIFGDETNGSETYGGGRYVLDTTKGADLGGGEGRLVVDFNFAYHPSCVHSPRWSCPLPPVGNTLQAPIRAGERLR